MRRRATPNVLTIAGSDPSGGAGIQADLRTFAALGAFGCAVPAVLTVQNTVEITGVHVVPATLTRRQLDALFADVEIAAVKIGMLGSARVAGVVADALARHAPRFVVVDPVLRGSTGARLATRDLARALTRELAPLATVVTPNAAEAAALLRGDAVRTADEARAAARSLVEHGWRAALVTGGHLDDRRWSVDVLAAGRGVRELRVRRVPGPGAHGTGCTLSSAIAAYLARGRGLAASCSAAQRFTAESIARSRRLRVGRGTPPANQLSSTPIPQGRARERVRSPRS
ncbi:MAG: bifunctional hydroxymethylpyrimidine kinase/phosphomethylpyrimidine kinase [Gemmatimonadota bacterium]|nr:bifunctional hydroxymethylpyrimidine kinase/phosphomethylpyrimidine kinase [Gemmatimonadota bacterium]